MKFLDKIFKELFLAPKFAWASGIVILAFAIAYSVPIVFRVAQVLLALLITLSLIDCFLLFGGSRFLVAKRVVPKIMSNGYDHVVKIILLNKASIELKAKVIDELPYQLQIRDCNFIIRTKPRKKNTIEYRIRPTQRGDYFFGNILLFLQTRIGLAERKYSIDATRHLSVYPSIIEMKKYELNAFKSISQLHGLKRIRKIGHSQEFDHIKEYVFGDDYQSINWNATSRTNKLMVNHYEDEKSQQIYCLIDKSRVMKLPFNNMSILEYAINTTLTISNTILNKHDKAGVVTFSNKIDRYLKADRTRGQLRRILKLLYNESTNFEESNYEQLYQFVSGKIQLRSLLLLFTNFESDYALQRNLSILRKMNKRHLLVVIFFENSELQDFAEQKAESLQQIYNNTIAQRLMYEKQLVTNKLTQHGIQTLLTKPEDLSINVINKYLELKGKGLI